MSIRSAYQAAGQVEDATGIAARVANITVSVIKQMPFLASKMEGCISLGQGIPSFNTPAFIREGVAELLRTDEALSRYTLQPGLPQLKRAIASSIQRTKQVAVDPEQEIFVSCGGMEALAAGLSAIVDRGDEVLLPTPTYSSHIEQVLFAEGKPVFVPLLEDGWHLDIEGFRKAITPRTKAIVLCSPANPTGAVYSEENLRALGALAVEHDLFVVADEAYDFLTYDENKHFSLLAVPELRDRIMAVYSFSKKYCMTGWRVGYMVASPRLIVQALKVHDAFAICAPAISQYAALIALEGTNGVDGAGDESIQELSRELSERRDQMCQRLDRIPELFSYQKPQGAYYVFPKINLATMTSMELALELLYQAKVITVPGSGFGPTGEGYIRMSFGGDEASIDEAFDRIERWFGGQKK